MSGNKHQIELEQSDLALLSTALDALVRAQGLNAAPAVAELVEKLNSQLEKKPLETSYER